MNFPNVNEDTCPVADPCAQQQESVATGTLIVKPETVILCGGDAIQFSAYLQTDNGEEPVTTSVVFTSSDPSLLTIDSATGQGTPIAAGAVTVTATWRDLTAYAKATILDGDNCCDQVQVKTVLCLDNSKSMSQPFPGYTDKLTVAKQITDAVATQLLEKDLDALIAFSDAPVNVVGFVDDPLIVEGGIAVVVGTNNTTDLAGAFDAALSLLTP
jgi:Bacterial Ig-like domain (group 2)/von Willebrand factor type A domain